MAGDVLKQLRKKNNYSQEEISKYLSISRPLYSDMEKGKKSLTIEQAKKLADMYDVLPETFLYGDIEKYDVNINASKKDKGKKQNDMRIDVPQKNIEKFKQVLLYILNKVGGKPNVGETVLYKLLYFIDMDYYEKYEEQLMGLTYIKNHHGPTPVEFKKVIEQMIEDGQLDRIKSKYFKYDQKKYIAVKEPDLIQLGNAREIEHINEELNRLSDKNASELSELSHRDVPWIGAAEKGRIEYEAVFYRTKETSVREYGD
ncbi:MAG: DUF4065 domain-containing protein [candidate division WOR-3 bacterium]|nr:DUF4065 domain-containing protein [candidate division WOR-3 bacterium]